MTRIILKMFDATSIPFTSPLFVSPVNSSTVSYWRQNVCVLKLQLYSLHHSNKNTARSIQVFLVVHFETNAEVALKSVADGVV
jgi:hypothetical protein